MTQTISKRTAQLKVSKASVTQEVGVEKVFIDATEGFAQWFQRMGLEITGSIVRNEDIGPSKR